MNTNMLPDLIIFFSALFAFVLATGQLVLQNKNRNNILLSALLACYGFFQLSNSFSLFKNIKNWQEMYSVMHLVGIVSFFNIGPLLFLYFKAIVKSPITISKKTALHFIPGFMYALFFTINKMMGNNFLDCQNLNSHLSTYNTVYKIMTFSSVVILILYCLKLIKHLVSLFMQKYSKEKKSLRISLYCVTALFILAVLWLINVSMSLGLIKIIHLSLSLYIIFIYILSNKYPQLLHIVKLESQRDYYIRSQTKGLDINSIMKKLYSLMNENKIFSDETLTVKQLASELNITPHQLSEILNQKIGKTFYHYINGMRVEEAKILLKTDSERSILSITYDVGFNSTSAFYNAFKKHTGYSPSDYRKKFIK
jgi:AraC-like DNA-binding protein